MKKIISYIIPNYNRREFLRQCLSSIFNQGYENKEVIVVDNGSSDGSCEMVRKEFKEVRLVKNAQNLMVAQAYNQGIELSNSEYVFCLNNDVVLDKDYTRRALSCFNIDRRIGAVCGKLVNPLTKRLDSTGQVLTFSRRAYERGYRVRDRGQFSQSYVWGVPGACALYKREMLENVKINGEYFDNSYKAYLEDLDLNWRMNNLGWKAYFTPEAVAYHYRGVTGWKDNFSKLGYLNLPFELRCQFIKNRYATLIKNETLINFIKYAPFIVSYNIYLWIFLLSQNPQVVVKSLYTYKDLKTDWRKRKLIFKKIEKRRKRWQS